jgi:hypothetical protein
MTKVFVQQYTEAHVRFLVHIDPSIFTRGATSAQSRQRHTPAVLTAAQHHRNVFSRSPCSHARGGPGPRDDRATVPPQGPRARGQEDHIAVQEATGQLLHPGTVGEGQPACVGLPPVASQAVTDHILFAARSTTANTPARRTSSSPSGMHRAPRALPSSRPRPTPTSTGPRKSASPSAPPGRRTGSDAPLPSPQRSATRPPTSNCTGTATTRQPSGTPAVSPSKA